MLILLLVCLALPLVTAALLMLFRGSAAVETARWIALFGAILTLLAACGLFAEYRHLDAPAAWANSPIQPRFEYQRPWLSTQLPGTAEQAGSLNLTMHIGLDGISVAMILLTAVLSVSSILISWESIRQRPAEFYAALLTLQTGVVGAFCAFDVVLFYAFFEITLIPLFFMMLCWGGPQRRTAAMTFFLYTFAGSVITLLGLITLIVHAARAGVANPTSIPALAQWLQNNPLSPELQGALFLAISAGFLVKVPLFPFHSWLPLTYAEAPTAGTVFASGVLAKLGAYGFLRFCIPMFPEACLKCGVPLIGTLSVIGIVYGSLCALSQRDMKRLVAYSSVAHLGFCMLGLFALNVEGLAGGVLQMVNHGLSTAALFLLVAMVADRYQTRQIPELGGLATRLPLLACCMVFMSMASIGLPGLNGFTGEFLSLAGMFARHPLYAIIGTSGVILGAWYLLTLVQSVFFGPVKEPTGATVRDLHVREAFALAPLAALCLAIGVYPQPLLNIIRPDVEAVAKLYVSPAPETVAAKIVPDQAQVATTVEPAFVQTISE